MTKMIDLKEFSFFLRVHRNDIIHKWIEKNEVKNILHKHSLPTLEKNTQILYSFCDCFISLFEWDFTIGECSARADFLELLHLHNLSTSELFTLIIRLQTALEESIYENGNLSYNLQKELETITLEIANDLIETYERLQGENKDFSPHNHTNLLSEYKKAVDLSNIVSKTNPKGIITYVNDHFCEISGYTREELIGQPHNIIRHPGMDRHSFKDLWDTIKNKKAWHGIVTNMKKNGDFYIVDTHVVPILDMDGDIIEFIAVRHDITELEKTKEQLKNINKAMKNKVDELFSMASILEEKATKDTLTRLYNRSKFEELFGEEITTCRKHKKSLSLIVFDIDYFKPINDTYGHQFGDKILIEIGSLVSKNIKMSDILARWGGEEFAIILPDTDIEGATLFANKIRKIIENHIFSEGKQITASFGVGELYEHEDKLTLFEKVDKALYVAKNKGRNRVEQALFNCVY